VLQAINGNTRWKTGAAVTNGIDGNDGVTGATGANWRQGDKRDTRYRWY